MTNTQRNVLHFYSKILFKKINFNDLINTDDLDLYFTRNTLLYYFKNYIIYGSFAVEIIDGFFFKEVNPFTLSIKNNDFYQYDKKISHNNFILINFYEIENSYKDINKNRYLSLIHKLSMDFDFKNFDVALKYHCDRFIELIKLGLNINLNHKINYGIGI